MDESDDCISLAESDSNSAQEEPASVDRRLTGAMKRRKKWWIRQGKSAKEAEDLAIKPYIEIPEYNEIQKVNDDKKLKKQTKSAKFKRNSGIDFTLLGIKGKNYLMNEKQLQVLKNYIRKRFCDSAQGEYPSFCGCYSRCGILIMKCVGEHTVNWVTTIFPSLEPWEHSKLTLLNEREIKSEISLFFRRRQAKEDLKTSVMSNGDNLSDNNGE